MLRQNTKFLFKLGTLFILSLASTYFIVTQLLLQSLYWIMIGAIASLACFAVSMIPIGLILYWFTKSVDHPSHKKLLLLGLAPTFIGSLFSLSTLLTLGKTLEPIKQFRMEQMAQSITVTPKSIRYIPAQYQEDCNCVRPEVEIAVKVDNHVNFAVTLEIYPTNRPDIGGGSCISNIKGTIWAPLKKGVQIVKFSCTDYLENKSKAFFVKIRDLGDERVNYSTSLSANSFPNP